MLAPPLTLSSGSGPGTSLESVDKSVNSARKILLDDRIVILLNGETYLPDGRLVNSAR